MSIIWVLGTPDAEMSAIESLLRECGQPFLYALAPVARRDPDTGRMVAVTTEDGSPVYQRVPSGQPAAAAGEVYLTGDIVPRPLDGLEVIAIEVAGPWGPAHIDHHEGHERAAWGPERFLQASSLGQVVERLAEMSALPSSWSHGWGPPAESGPGCEGVWCRLGELMVGDGRWTVCTLAPGWGRDACFATIPQALVMEAAADHCPAAAIKGRCPGVDPEPFAPFLAESKRRQYFPWMSPEEFARELDRSRATLRSAPPCVELCPPAQWMGAAEAGDEWGDLVAIGPHTGVRPVVRDLRHLKPGTVPAQGSGEMYPTEFLVGIVAAIFEGLGFVCRIRRGDGKLALRSNGHGLGSLAGTRPAEVFLSDPSAFGCGPRFPAGQDASYGSPVRGFFGGLLIDQG